MPCVGGRESAMKEGEKCVGWKKKEEEGVGGKKGM